jgi:uncharacterized repeat protein (TIGR03806 family)
MGLTVLSKSTWKRWAAIAILAMPLTLVAITGCGSRNNPTVSGFQPYEKLSEYGLFVGNGATQEAADGVVPYDLNSALFSDYANKHRFVKLPPGTSAKYDPDKVFDFPVGSIVAKTFGCLHDIRDPSKGERLLETRLLVHTPEGWLGLPYVWNKEQTEAFLDVGGSTVDVSWVHTDGKDRSVNYVIPNANQCKSCHENNKIQAPIGPKARNLNKDFAYKDGTENQLVHWTKAGILEGAPSPDEAPRLAKAMDPSSGTLDERARAWLEINCAHCHNPEGPAKTSGLDLMASQQDPSKYGILKTPVAAGRGAGGFTFDILPGKPAESILMYRLLSTDPGVMMPELPRRLVDDEGVALIHEWIAQMPPVESTKEKPSTSGD